MDYRHPLEMHHARREDAAGAGSNAELLLMFADVICPKLRDLLVPHGASATNWDDAAKQLRGIAAALSTAEREPGNITLSADEIDSLRYCIKKADYCIRAHSPPAGYAAVRGDLARAFDVLARAEGESRVPSGGEEGR